MTEDFSANLMIENFLKFSHPSVAELKETKLLLCLAIEQLGGKLNVTHEDIINPPNFEMFLDKTADFYTKKELVIAVKRHLPILEWDAREYHFNAEYHAVVFYLFHFLLPGLAKIYNFKE